MGKEINTIFISANKALRIVQIIRSIRDSNNTVPGFDRKKSIWEWH